MAKWLLLPSKKRLINLDAISHVDDAGTWYAGAPRPVLHVFFSPQCRVPPEDVWKVGAPSGLTPGALVLSGEDATTLWAKLEQLSLPPALTHP